HTHDQRGPAPEFVSQHAEQNRADEDAEIAEAEDLAHGARLCTERTHDGRGARVHRAIVEPVDEKRQHAEAECQRLKTPDPPVFEERPYVDVAGDHSLPGTCAALLAASDAIFFLSRPSATHTTMTMT